MCEPTLTGPMNSSAGTHWRLWLGRGRPYAEGFSKIGPRTLTATNGAELREIDGVLHDQHFELSELAHDSRDRTLAIPFFVEDPPREGVLRRSRAGRPKLAWVPLCRGLLRIENVTDYLVDDRSQIDIYMAVDIRFEEERSRLTIEAAEDCEIEVHSKPLSVRLDVSDEIVARVKRRYFLLGDATQGFTRGHWPYA